MHKSLPREAYLKKSIICILLIIISFVLTLSAGCTREEAVIELEREEAVAAPDQDPNEGNTGAEISTVTVYVCGAVRHPGVYELAGGARIVDALDAAGGMNPAADHDHINQAMLLQDGVRVYIPTMEETALAGTAGTGVFSDSIGAEDPQAGGKVNINTADAAELMTLPGIGEAKAALIIEYREQNGRFGSIEDIMNISGIKEGMFNRIKDKISI